MTVCWFLLTQTIIPASVTFIDIAGLVAGASKGEGLGNQFLSHIRTCSSTVQVVRGFDDRNVLRSDSSKDPLHDIEVVNTELVLADLQAVGKRLPQAEKIAKADPKLRIQADTLREVQSLLNEGIPLFGQSKEWLTNNAEALRDLQLLTMKPMIYLFNVDESTLSDTTKQAELTKLVTPAKALFVNAKLEDELRSLDEVDRTELLESYGVHESGLVQLIHAAYDTLGLQSYLTAGEKEIRAWTISHGSTATEAAGVIHGDFEQGFIAAQIVNYHDLTSAGSEAAARSAGKVRTEGKTYMMQADDVVEFRFNVSK